MEIFTLYCAEIEYNFGFGEDFLPSISNDVWVTKIKASFEEDIRQKFEDKYPYDCILEITKKISI